MRITQSHIDAYLEAKRLAWSPSTLRSERARLGAWLAELSGTPEALWQAMEMRGLRPYSRVTTWTRICQFVDWCIATKLIQGTNAYVAWRKENARLFKNAYVPKFPEMGFEEAEQRVRTLPAATARRAVEILYSGLRFTESQTHAAGRVVGKGGATRQVYVPPVAGPDLTQSYSTFVRHLRSVGLAPHMLRKLALMEFVDQGATAFELRTIAGWKSLAPAVSYIDGNPRRIAALAEKVHQKRKVG
jgi:hypothetical protein